MSGKKSNGPARGNCPDSREGITQVGPLQRASKITVALAMLFAACAANTSFAHGRESDDDDNARKMGVITTGGDSSAGTPLDTTTYPCNKTGTCDSVRDAVTIAAPKCDAQFVYWGPGNSCGANVPMLSDVSTDGTGQFRKATMSLWDVLQGNGGNAVVSCLATGRLNVDSQSCPPPPPPPPPAPAPAPYYDPCWYYDCSPWSPPAPAPSPWYDPTPAPSPSPAPAPTFDPSPPPPPAPAPEPPPPPAPAPEPPPPPAPAPEPPPPPEQGGSDGGGAGGCGGDGGGGDGGGGCSP